MIIEAPNEVFSVGTYEFFVNDWLVAVNINAPCNLKSLQGLDTEGILTVLLDEEKVILLQFNDD